MTTREVAKTLRVTTRTVRRFVASGELAPCLLRRAHGAQLFRPEDIKALHLRRQQGLIETDDAAILRGAVELMAEEQAEEQRPLCPSCVKRRVNRGGDFCLWCEEDHRLYNASAG